MTAPFESVELRTYRYICASDAGTVRAGELLAASEAAALAVLRERGQWPLEIGLAVHTATRGPSMSVRDLGVGFRVLATLLEAHIPAGKVMRVAAPSMPESWKHAIPRMSAALESGDTFAAAIRTSDVPVPAVLDGLVRAGEAAGDLGGALRRSAEFAEKSAAMRAMIRDAVAYPALLMMAGAGVVGLLVTVVIPRFSEVLATLGQPLPLSTRIVLAAAAIARVGALPGLLAIGAVSVGFTQWQRAEGGRRTWHEWLLTVPLLGDLRHAMATARVADALAALLACGVPVARALPLAAAASGDAAVETRILRARQQIVEGHTIAQALGSTRALTDSAVRLIGAGEAGGALGELLRHAASLENERAAARTKALVRVIEPALILLLGAIVSGVAVALLQAVYSVRVDTL